MKWKSKFLITFKIFGPIAMPNDLSNPWGKDSLWHFILGKSNQFDLKLSEFTKLIFWFCLDEQEFSTLCSSFHGNKDSIFAVIIITKEKAKFVEPFSDEQPLKISELVNQLILR